MDAYIAGVVGDTDDPGDCANREASNSCESDNLVPIAKVPEKFRHVFSNYLCFNRIQSEVFHDVFNTEASLVVSAPTGSGKTVVFELAISKLMYQYDMLNENYSFMIIYVAPIKALCEERMLDWHKKFSNIGINCISVTGDSDVVSVQNLCNHNMIITTPEKWDSLTRRWRSNMHFINRVALFMIDEVHLLNDESRGPTLEAIMSRMKTIEDSKKANVGIELQRTIRFLAISATLPNVEDIAEWIGTRACPAKYFNFNEEARPVKLTKIVHGYYYNSQMSTPFKFDIMLSYKLQGIILQYSNGKPTLIFCSTRKSVEMTTKHLSQNLTITLTGEQKSVLQAAASNITTPGIRETLIHGVGSHHAGMLPDSRRVIENLFRNGDLPILVTTSTLAMGINLPAHLVIIKSTKYYSTGEYRDYTESVLLQMIGRAGRPQFDTSATAVILTTSAEKNKFENMIHGTECIESHLHKHLIEHLNAEIVLRTITDIGIAMQWLTSTFLYIRARKHPTHYGISANLSQDQIDKKLLDMCQIEINKLERVGMILVDDGSIVPTEMGSLMAKFCVNFQTMKLFREVQGTEVLQQILALISKCHEFSEMYLRVNDKKTLNLLNKCKNRETIRFPLSGKIKTLDMKINCIIQAVFGCLQILEPSLINEAQKVMRIGERISKCLSEYLETKEKCYSALLNAVILAKCFHCRIWENSPYVSRQLAGIGAVMSSHLVIAGKVSFQSLLATSPRNLEMIIRRKPPMGDTIIEAVQQLPHYTLQILENKLGPKKSHVKILVQLLNYENLEYKLTLDPDTYMNLIVGDDSNNILLYAKYSHSFMVESRHLEIEIPGVFVNETTINAHFISEIWAGIDCTATYELFPKPKEKIKPGAKISKAKRHQKKIDQILGAKVTPHVQNHIDQYFKLVKNASTHKPAIVKEDLNSIIKPPIVQEDLSSKNSEIDEAKLLESDNEFSNWEPLDEKLLESSNDEELCALVDIIESENDLKVEPTLGKTNESLTEITADVVDLTDDKYVEESEILTEFEKDFFENDTISNIDVIEKRPTPSFQYEKDYFTYNKDNSSFQTSETLNDNVSKVETPKHMNPVLQSTPKNLILIHEQIVLPKVQINKPGASMFTSFLNDLQGIITTRNSEEQVLRNSNSDDNQAISINRSQQGNPLETSSFVETIPDPREQLWEYDAIISNSLLNQLTGSNVEQDALFATNQQNEVIDKNIVCSGMQSDLTSISSNTYESFGRISQDFNPNEATVENKLDPTPISVYSDQTMLSSKIPSSAEGRIDSFMDNIRQMNLPDYPISDQHAPNTESMWKQFINSPIKHNSSQQMPVPISHGFSTTTQGQNSTTLKYRHKNEKRKKNNKLGMTSFYNLFNTPKTGSVRNPLNFEKSTIEVKDVPNIQEEFSYTPKKKISHTVTLNTKSEADSTNEVLPPKRMKYNFGGSQSNGDKKSIKWRSPLVEYPNIKYSPKIFDRNLLDPRSRHMNNFEVMGPSTYQAPRTPSFQQGQMQRSQNTSNFEPMGPSTPRGTFQRIPSCQQLQAQRSQSTSNLDPLGPSTARGLFQRTPSFQHMQTQRSQNAPSMELTGPSTSRGQRTPNIQEMPTHTHFNQPNNRFNEPTSAFPQTSQNVAPLGYYHTPTNSRIADYSSKQSKRRHALPSASTFRLNVPKSVNKLPITDEDCGYSHDSQYLENTQRTYNELNDFFTSPSVETFKPRERDRKVIQNVASYIRPHEWEPVINNPQEHFEMEQNETGQEWWNQPSDNEGQIKEELQREIKDMLEPPSMQYDPNYFNIEDPFPSYLPNVESQCITCGSCNDRNPLQNLSNQQDWNMGAYNYNVQDQHFRFQNDQQMRMYENYPPVHWNNIPIYDQVEPSEPWDNINLVGNQWEQSNLNTFEMAPPMNTMCPQPPRGYNTEYRQDLMERYLNTQKPIYKNL